MPTTVARTTTAYKRVGPNIYKDGNSYRVRYKKNGKMFSRNFTTRKEAYSFRNEHVK